MNTAGEEAGESWRDEKLLSVAAGGGGSKNGRWGEVLRLCGGEEVSCWRVQPILTNKYI